MGKHDKEQTHFTWEPPKDNFYKARIERLEKENAMLKAELLEKERSIGCYELNMDHQEDMHNGIIGEYKAELAEKDDEIIILKGKIEMLKEAIVNGALREVLK